MTEFTILKATKMQRVTGIGGIFFKTKYFLPSEKEFMVNYRVKELILQSGSLNIAARLLRDSPVIRLMIHSFIRRAPRDS